MSVILNDKFIKSECYCLNEDMAFPHSNLFDGGGSAPIKSNTDEQLLLHLAFQQTVRVTSIVFGIPDGGECPQTIRIFANKSNLGFSEASDETPTQEINIEPGVESKTVSLSGSKWQRIESVSIFVVDNYGAPVSSLNFVRIYGQTLQSFDVGKIHAHAQH